MSESLPRDEQQADFECHIEAYATYLETIKRLSPNTVRAYRTDLDAFALWVRREGVLPYTVSVRELRRYLMELRRARYSTRTISRHLSALRGLYRWLLHEGVTVADAVAALQSPKLARELPKTMDNDDVDRMLESCDLTTPEGVRDRAFLELLYASGARVSEVSALDIGSVDLSQGQVKLFGKGSKERIVPLYATAVSWVRRYLLEVRPQLAALTKPGKESEALFLSVRGNRMSADALRTCFKRHAALAGVDPSLATHAMRHTYATELLGGGADLRSVQELLGHASLSTTQIYTHLSVDRLKETARQAHPRGE